MKKIYHKPRIYFMILILMILGIKGITSICFYLLQKKLMEKVETCYY